ncbi:MAG: prolipoprotein diacylglyceryl transferase family protein [Patescibacteria group bacterium]
MHPIIFQTNFFILHTLWLFFVIGVIAGTYAMIKLSIKNGLKIQFISENFLKFFLFGIIAARLSFIILNYEIYFSELSIDSLFRLFYVWDKGLYFWPGLIASFISFYDACKKNDQNFYKWLDILVPSIIIGLGITHIGAFFDGINYGIETSLPWGVNFESPSIKYAVPIHPTQIYAFLYSTIIATTLILMGHNEKIKSKAPGFIGFLGIIGYSSFRFLEEFIRGDDTILIVGVRLDQVITLLVLISATWFFYKRLHLS